MRSQGRVIALVVMSFILVGCGSMFKTTYQHVPPTTAEGQKCVAQCAQSKRMCKRLCVSDKQCRQQARKAAQQRYEANKAANPQSTKTVADYINARECDAQDNCGCQEDYNACFEMCGGQLIAKRHCIANCS